MKFTADGVTQWPRGRNDLVPPASHRPRLALRTGGRGAGLAAHGPSVTAQLCGPRPAGQARAAVWAARTMGIAGRKPRSLAGIRGSTAQPSARPQPEPWGPYRLRLGEGPGSSLPLATGWGRRALSTIWGAQRSSARLLVSGTRTPRSRGAAVRGLPCPSLPS